MSLIESRFLSTRRASMFQICILSAFICGLKRLASRVRVLWREFDNLFRSGDGHRQTPLELFVARKRGVQPPTARRKHYCPLPLLVQTRVDGRATLHALFEKVFKT